MTTGNRLIDKRLPSHRISQDMQDQFSPTNIPSFSARQSLGDTSSSQMKNFRFGAGSRGPLQDSRIGDPGFGITPELGMEIISG
jgi:hypothetical protein